MSSVVVDTHVIIWDWLAPAKISTKARKAITEADRNHQLIICEISLWEIAMLLKKKRITPAIAYMDLMTDILISRNYKLQGITTEIALLATEISIDTRDPADKLIAATSIALGLPLISADRFKQQSNDIKIIW